MASGDTSMVRSSVMDGLVFRRGSFAFQQHQPSRHGQRAAANCGPLIAPPSKAARPSGSRQNSVKKMAMAAPRRKNPARSPGWRRCGSQKNRKKARAEKGEGRVSLDRMQRNAQRSAAPERGLNVRAGDGPMRGHSPGFDSIARAGQQRAQLLEGQPESQGRGQRVGGVPQWKPLPAAVKKRGQKRGQRREAGQQRMMNHGEPQHPGRMKAQSGPVERDEQNARGDKRGKERQDAEVPELPRVEARDTRRALRQKERQQDAHGGRGAIRRDEKRADVEEDWMHADEA